MTKEITFPKSRLNVYFVYYYFYKHKGIRFIFFEGLWFDDQDSEVMCPGGFARKYEQKS